MRNNKLFLFFILFLFWRGTHGSVIVCSGASGEFLTVFLQRLGSEKITYQKIENQGALHLADCTLPEKGPNSLLLSFIGKEIRESLKLSFDTEFPHFLANISQKDISLVAAQIPSQGNSSFNRFDKVIQQSIEQYQLKFPHIKWMIFDDNNELNQPEIISLLFPSPPPPVPSPSLVVEGSYFGRLVRNAIWLSVAFSAALLIFHQITNQQQEAGEGEKKQKHENDEGESVVDLGEEQSESCIDSPNLISPEVVNASRCWVIVGVVFFCCFLLDYEHTFPPMNKHFDVDYFIFVCLIFTGFGSLWIQEAKIPEGRCGMLNRDQTEEWRGWMQISFLLYHYFSAAPVYTLIRVFVACYVWMTGFGHFSYFWIRKDWSPIRFVKSLFRMNFLVAGIMAVMETDYVHYYICPMHTFFFFLVWGVTYPFREYHHTHTWVVWVKLGLTFLACAIVWSNDFLFNIIFGWFPFLYQNGSLHEWHFRSGLDRFATAFGMLFAFIYPNLEEMLFALDKMETKGMIIKSLITILFFCLFFVWYFVFGTMEKYAYNAIHPHTSFIPICCFIFLRNMFPTMRKYFLWGFSWVGKITLETYLLQFHLMLNNNNKQIVNFFDGYPSLNFLFTWLVLLGAAYQAFKCTVVLSDFFYPYTLSPIKVLNRTAILTLSSFIFLFFSFIFTMIETQISPVIQWMLWLILMVFGMGSFVDLIPSSFYEAWNVESNKNKK